MTTALKVLDPPIRLFGLAAYALSATFAPNVSTALAALWIDGVDDWRFVFYDGRAAVRGRGRAVAGTAWPRTRPSGTG